MSTALAYRLPLRPVLPGNRPQEPVRRHIEIVTTRAQRKARPRSFYAIVTVSSVFGLLLAQLLLSIALSAGAYQIAGLQTSQKQLTRTAAALSEQLDLLASPQSLATKAEGLGMVVNSSTPVFIRLSDGTVIGSGSAAGAQGVLGAKGSLVPNALLTDAASNAALIGSADDSASTIGSATGTPKAGAPTPAVATASVASTNGSLPSPVTR
jgi:hypothetical protein